MSVPAKDDDERGAFGGIPCRATSIKSSYSSAFTNIDLTQEMLDEETRRNILGRKQRLETKVG